MPTKIVFRGRNDEEPGDDVTVHGDKEEVRRKLRANEPVTTLSDQEILVNWSNVLYVEEGYESDRGFVIRPPDHPYDD